ncbi:Squalene epoxidase [Scheffersomyces spartinae]|uniref:Squalene monooxygenase n=1 Tax=Scheffersomyces spartinae TaxID=45513 RepID=A0A9P7VEH9_9ASCO|nr:Squalene epoxidase [Scheffersomyces spartinae]KAG7196197.1 Squalene epoxidase [Scheffersomyces spartinae]
MTESDSYDVIVVGAGVVGPTVATALARQGRKVMIVERDWSMPDRIVGELMQPGGLKALRELGMIQAINNIEAIHVSGYYILFGGSELNIDYPEKTDANRTNQTIPVPDCVKDDNDKVLTDSTIKSEEWDNDPRVRGVAFRHGEFLMNLRKITKSEPNVTAVEGNVTQMIKSPDDPNRVIGVRVKKNKDVYEEYYAKVTIACDGIYSKFRKELGEDYAPTVESHFVGLSLMNCDLPSKYRGHVVLGTEHFPVIIYQISPEETRILCAYKSTKTPPQAELYQYLQSKVLPGLPKPIRPSFSAALETRKFRVMPNQYLPARKQGRDLKGYILIGDSLNMRHPLTGGGMTVGLNDAVLLTKLLHPENIEDLSNQALLEKRLLQFHTKRKNLDGVINTLSIALYSLFAADSRPLKILQKGCYQYFLRGGSCVSGPIGLLSGMLPFPMILFNHFFSVAFFAIYCNIVARGLLGFPMAIYEAFETLYTAVVIFTPYIIRELM